jgi:hypothetical protein
VRATRILVDFPEHMCHQLSPQIWLGKLLLEASERQSNHVGRRNGNALKLSLSSDPPDPVMLLGR